MKEKVVIKCPQCAKGGKLVYLEMYIEKGEEVKTCPECGWIYRRKIENKRGK
ncbi:MAG: hypothetical protein QXS18_05620 [Thermoplasmata archaeon]